MTARECTQRAEAVLALLRRLRQRPVIAKPEHRESPGELFERIDTLSHAAGLGEEQYRGLRRSKTLAWKSALAFLARDEEGAVTHAFWMNPLALTCYGCRLDEEDLQVLAPSFCLEPPHGAGTPARTDSSRPETERGGYDALLKGRRDARTVTSGQELLPTKLAR